MLSLPYELALALRYMMSRRKDAFVSLITIISIAGISLGVAALIIVLSVMNGFEGDLKSKILGTNAHLVVLRSGGGVAAYDWLQNELHEKFGDRIAGVTPFIYNQGMLTSRSNVLGTVVRGVDLATVTQVTEVKNYVIEGSLDDLAPTALTVNADGVSPTMGIAVGKELAFNLGVRLGDSVNLVSPTGEITPFGSAPRIRTYVVRMIFSTGMYEYDSALAYLNLAEAQSFFGMEGMVTGLEIKLRNPDRSEVTAGLVAAHLGFPYYTRDWKDLNKNLFGALQLEKIAMSIILILIVLVAAFNIVSTLFMVVLEKGKDIAILMSMGASQGSVRRIFVYEGLIIGVIGAILGTVIGVTLTVLLDKYQFIELPKDIYYIDRLPVRMVNYEIVLIAAGAVVISTLATLYPAWRAGRIDPVEGIRYGAE